MRSCTGGSVRRHDRGAFARFFVITAELLRRCAGRPALDRGSSERHADLRCDSESGAPSSAHLPWRDFPSRHERSRTRLRSLERGDLCRAGLTRLEARRLAGAGAERLLYGRAGANERYGGRSLHGLPQVFGDCPRCDRPFARLSTWTTRATSPSYSPISERLCPSIVLLDAWMAHRAGADLRHADGTLLLAMEARGIPRGMRRRISKSAFEKDSQGGFGVIHRASDHQREPTPDAEEEAACKAALRHRSNRCAVGADRAHDPGCPCRRTPAEGDVARAGQRRPLFSAGGLCLEAAAA